MNALKDIQSIISEFSGTEMGKITLESNLKEDLNLDPLSVADIIDQIENKFSIKISQENLMNFNKISDIVELIEDQIE